METVTDFFSWALKSLQMVTAAMKLKDIAPWKKSYHQHRQHIKKQRHYFVDKGPSSQSYGFSSSHVWMWEVDHKESWAPKNRCFWTVVLEKTFESPLDCKKIQPVNPKGNQSWIIIGSTDAEAEAPILWPPDTSTVQFIPQSCLTLCDPMDCSTRVSCPYQLPEPSSHPILCHPLLLLPSVCPRIRVFPNESVLIRWPKYWSFSFSILNLLIGTVDLSSSGI